MRTLAVHTVALVVSAMLVGVASTAPPADARARQRPCADLELSYSAHIVVPGQVFDHVETLVNCSNRRETIRVRIRAFGPCDFPHVVSARYTLPAHFGVAADALVVAPECQGRYRIVGKAIVRGFIVDKAHAGFTVVDALRR
jgi:hypothetical protein